MKNAILFYSFFICQGFSSSAQENLVPNPSFEDTVACPVNGRVYNCQHWINCGNTPDYDHSCINNSYGVPENNFGFQFAATGNAYCNLWTYASNTFYREYIGIQLTHPLIINQEYYVSFKCSPGTLNGYSMQTNKLGLRFSTISYDSINVAPTNNFAHVYTDSIIRDTSNWTSISSYFTADSAYTFLTIGNFFDDLHTDTANYNQLSSFFSVYYVDDVEVIDNTTSISEIDSYSFMKYYKHGNELTFKSALLKINRVDIFDLTGRIILTAEGKNKYELTMKPYLFSSGIYIAKISSQNKIITIKCLIN